jgi:diketogulonate reductase-like aldo/keto reductase
MTLPGSEPYIDCLVLHSPLPTIEETLGAWEILSTFVPKNIHSLGISNTSLETLQYLYSQTILKPSVVQNRFYSETKWEVQLRKWCREKGIVFQSFWTLTGNPKIMASSIVKDMSEALDKVGVQDPTTVALYSLVIGLNGTCVLDGTTNDGRMKSDLEGLEVMGRLIEGEWRGRWAQWLGDFKKMIGELEDN